MYSVRRVVQQVCTAGLRTVRRLWLGVRRRWLSDETVTQQPWHPRGCHVEGPGGPDCLYTTNGYALGDPIDYVYIYYIIYKVPVRYDLRYVIYKVPLGTVGTGVRGYRTLYTTYIYIFKAGGRKAEARSRTDLPYSVNPWVARCVLQGRTHRLRQWRRGCPLRSIGDALARADTESVGHSPEPCRRYQGVLLILYVLVAGSPVGFSWPPWARASASPRVLPREGPSATSSDGGPRTAPWPTCVPAVPPWVTPAVHTSVHCCTSVGHPAVLPPWVNPWVPPWVITCCTPLVQC